MLHETFTLKKKHLGWLLLVGGVVGFLGIFSIDLLTIARAHGIGGLFGSPAIEHFRGPLGIGPAQRLALLLAAAVGLLGLTLLPLGDRPA